MGWSVDGLVLVVEGRWYFLEAPSSSLATRGVDERETAKLELGASKKCQGQGRTAALRGFLTPTPPHLAVLPPRKRHVPLESELE